MNEQERVDELLEQLLLAPDPALEAALTSAADAGLPAIAVSPLQGALLALLVRLTGAREVLELGTLGGYSTIWLARALPEGGKVTTLEADPDYAGVARANFEHAGVADRVDVVVGDARETIASLEGPYELVFIDADKASMPIYLEHALRLTRPGAVIVGDNVVRGGAVLEPADPSSIGSRRFLELVGAEPRLEATALQTVGAKGWDGLALALVVG